MASTGLAGFCAAMVVIKMRKEPLRCPSLHWRALRSRPAWDCHASSQEFRTLPVLRFQTWDDTFSTPRSAVIRRWIDEFADDNNCAQFRRIADEAATSMKPKRRTHGTHGNDMDSCSRLLWDSRCRHVSVTGIPCQESSSVRFDEEEDSG